MKKNYIITVDMGYQENETYRTDKVELKDLEDMMAIAEYNEQEFISFKNDKGGLVFLRLSDLDIMNISEDTKQDPRNFGDLCNDIEEGMKNDLQDAKVKILQSEGISPNITINMSSNESFNIDYLAKAIKNLSLLANSK